MTEIKSWADSSCDLLKVLQAADPAEKAAVYRQLGVRIDHTPQPAVTTGWLPPAH